MKRKIFFLLASVVIGIIGIFFVLSSENALVVHPRGVIARSELNLIITNILLMMVIVVPTYILLATIVWKYCIKNEAIEHNPDHSYGIIGELLMWGLPSIIVAIMALVTLKATFELDPYKPLESNVKPLVVQVVALDWKWLFIYPEQGIATLNYLHIPERTPIHLKLTADSSPMNSFWIPQLGGQIYSMAGMTTQLHLMADGPGKYVGRSVEINGEGYADMTFSVTSTSKDHFDQWVAFVKESHFQHLNEAGYQKLLEHVIDRSVTLYSDVDDGLYQKIVHKYMYPTDPVL